jgi:hypothetical protein
MWGGMGTGATCSVCLAAIDTDQVESEIQELGQTYHLHLQCMAVWESLIAPGRILQPVADGSYSAAGELLSDTRPE